MRHTLLASLLTLAFLNTAQAAPAKKIWITVGDDAYAQLQRVAPQSIAKQSRTISAGRGDQGLFAEQVHVVEVEESSLHSLSEAVHEELHRCGGFIAHNSYADALRALQPVQAAAITRPSYAIDNQAQVQPLLPMLQESHIASTIVTLSAFTNRHFKSRHGVAASDWLLKHWQGLAKGRNDIVAEQITHADYPQKSVMITIKGQTKPAEVIVIGGHLDSIHKGTMGEDTRAPGADDDASGIASMTEALRVLIAQGYKPDRTIKFIGYAAEEGGLRGSKDIAQRFKSQNTNVVGVMQLDMTNYKGSDSDIYLYTDYTDAAQNTFLADLIKTYLPNLKVGQDKCGYGCSDHASWTAQGYPASMPFEASFSGMNKRIHTAEDTFENMGSQAQHALKFAQLATAYAVELGSDASAPGNGGGQSETQTGSLKQGQNLAYGPYRLTAGARLTAQLTGQGDADIYLRAGSAPTKMEWDCRPYRGDSEESCSSPAGYSGDVYLMVDGYRDASYTLTIKQASGK